MASAFIKHNFDITNYQTYVSNYKLQNRWVVKNPYFKLSADNITPSMIEKFFLEKIHSNIKTNISFLHFLIKKSASIKMINTTNYDNNISVPIFWWQIAKKTYIFEIAKVRIMFLKNIVQTINQLKI